MSEFDPRPSIADLNDAFRQSGQYVATPGVLAMDSLDGLLESVRTFNDFTPDNDPYGEHDFGAFDWEGERVLWKIDYYDLTYTAWEDPLSDECHRVLTVMLSQDY